MTDIEQARMRAGPEVFLFYAGELNRHMVPRKRDKTSTQVKMKGMQRRLAQLFSDSLFHRNAPQVHATPALEVSCPRCLGA